jgi:hypothetical protein
MSNQLHKLKIDLLKVTGARKFTAKDGSEHVAIPATSLYMGKGAYLDLDMRGNRDGEDQYGNSHFIAISPTKEQRMAKEKTPIIGNAKTLTFGDSQPQPQRQQPVSTPKPSSDAFDDEADDLPF